MVSSIYFKNKTNNLVNSFFYYLLNIFKLDQNNLKSTIQIFRNTILFLKSTLLNKTDYEDINNKNREFYGIGLSRTSHSITNR
jgi:hypothetical protein